MKIARCALSILTLGMMAASVSAAVVPDKDQIMGVLNQYKPGNTGYGIVKVESASVNDAKKTVTISLNEAGTYLPLTVDQLAQVKADILATLPESCKDYTVTITAAGKNFDELALFAPKKNEGPTEEGRWITDMGAPEAPKGLEGKNIAMWQSHGWYFEPKLNRWEWQRARIFQTVEDLYTQSYVMPFLMPMLQNAGAYVMSPRERDTSAIEVIVDEDGGFTTGHYTESDPAAWTKTSQPGFAYKKDKLHNGDNPFKMGTARMANATPQAESYPVSAQWFADMPEKGNYAVYVSYQSLPNSSTEALYRVNSRAGSRDFVIDQTRGGGTWVYLGHFPLDKGRTDLPTVELFNRGPEGTVVTADAVKVGGGMGNVERIVKEPLDKIDYKYVGSNYPRFVEGARYWLQWAGAPDSVFTPSNYVNDYTDDYRSRALWVNWLTGGSSMAPKQKGLRIPIDLSFAFHTDAGTTLNDSIIGTLGIYCTVGDKLGNGSSRLASRDLTDLVMTNIVRDVRTNWEPNWTRRGMWDKSYYEARVPEVPAMLLELLSHQNFADMKYGLDPLFRFDVSRAVYKGMLQFLAQRDGVDYVVQPLPVRAFAIKNDNTGDRAAQNYTLTWAETKDELEPTATPTYYIVEERVGDGEFRQVARVSEPKWNVSVSDAFIHSYRVIAGNDGGVSFPSEVLALRNSPGPRKQVLVVNGFTRVSAPDWFDSGEIAGFYDVRDHGVPYKEDISFIGSQFEFRRDIPWMDDDAAGFGASRSNYETKVIAGNTFDYVYTHGEAIANAGYGFISSSVEALMQNGLGNDGIPPVIDLILGKQKEGVQGRGAFGTKFKTFPKELQKVLTQYAHDGGNILVTGAYIATDLWDNPYSDKATLKADEKFATEVLGYHWRVDQASVTGEAYEVASRFPAFDGGKFEFSATLNEDCYVVESPDSLYPADSKTGATIMRYTENNLVAGIAMDNGKWRTVAIGFPFETILYSGERNTLMEQALKFLDAPQAPKTYITPKNNKKKNKKK